MKRNSDGLTPKILDYVENRDLRAIRTTPANASQFGETLIAQRTQLIEINSSYGFSRLRDVQETTGTGAVTNGVGTIDLSTGTTSGSSARLTSASIGRYNPGKGAEIGINVIISELPTGDAFYEWGGRDRKNDNRIVYGLDATGLYARVKRASAADEIFRQVDWNIDKLNGSGTSGLNLDVSNGIIFQMDFTWYGSGEIRWSVVDRIFSETRPIQQYPVAAHTYKPQGDVSVTSPNLALFAEANNGTTNQDLSVRVGGRQYSIVGTYQPITRLSSDFRGEVSTSTTSVPLISVRRKADFRDRAIRITKLSGIVTSTDHILEVRLDGTLTGASFGTPNDHQPDETALEYDTSATAITGGDVIVQKLAEGEKNNEGSFSNEILDFDIPENGTLTLCARTITGTGMVRSSLFQLREEW